MYTDNYYLFTLVRGLKQSQVNTGCSQTEIQDTIQHRLERTRIPCTECVSHTAYLAHGKSNGEARGRNRHNAVGKSYNICFVAYSLPLGQVILRQIGFTSTSDFILHCIRFCFVMFVFRVCVYYIICGAVLACVFLQQNQYPSYFVTTCLIFNKSK